jgi:hypothetical protein
VKKELDFIPENVEKVLVANFRDKVENLDVILEAKDLCEERNFRFIEICCKNQFGKNQLLNFLNLVFLTQQNKHLKTLLERNIEEQKIANTEFEMIAFEADYHSHLKWADVNLFFSFFFFFFFFFFFSTGLGCDDRVGFGFVGERCDSFGQVGEKTIAVGEAKNGTRKTSH